MVKCEYCDKEFKNESGLNIHKSRKHKEKIEKEKKDKREKIIKEKKEKQKKREKKLNKISSNNREKINKMPDHIQEYFKDQESSKEAINSRELFTADNDNIDLKTDIDEREIRKIATLLHNDRILKENGLNPIFNNYLIKLMRLKVSKERKSRAEFVGLSSTEIEDNLKDLNKNLSPLTKHRN